MIKVPASRASETDYTTYRVCGDDSVFTGSAVYAEYKSIMLMLGVTINEAKSVIHRGGLQSSAEFCKRVFVDGNELTTFPPKLIVQTAMNGRLAPQLQSELAKRGWGIPRDVFYDFMASLIDVESLEFLIILNTLPQHVSGLQSVVTPIGPAANKDTWYPGKYIVKDEDIIQAYTYIAVTEQLKRLDTLLRQTDYINHAIQTSSIGFHAPDLNVEIRAENNKTMKLIDVIGYKAPELSASHPICMASSAEVYRISALLTSLRSGTADISATALAGLLDAFRNSLIESWDDTEAARGQADRSLVSKAMDILGRIINMPMTDDKGQARPRRLDFTVMLAYVSRLWSVSWTLGRVVLVNSVKSRVITAPDQAKLKYTSVATTLSISDKFGLKSSKNSPH